MKKLWRIADRNSTVFDVGRIRYGSNEYYGYSQQLAEQLPCYNR